jgi:hypothetical protein
VRLGLQPCRSAPQPWFPEEGLLPFSAAFAVSCRDGTLLPLPSILYRILSCPGVVWFFNVAAGWFRRWRRAVGVAMPSSSIPKGVNALPLFSMPFFMRFPIVRTAFLAFLL